MCAILDNFNRDDGFDFASRDFYAEKCGMDVSTCRKCMKGLLAYGHVLRRRVPRPGQYDLWQTTLPVLLNASMAIEQNREAKKSKSGGRIIEFPASHRRPNGLIIPGVVVVDQERGGAAATLKAEDELEPDGEALPSLPTQEHLLWFKQVLHQWGGAALAAGGADRFLRHAVAQALKVEAPDDVEKAIVRALACCEEAAARPRENQRAKLVNYFSKAFDGQLHQLRKDRLSREEELRLLPELKRAEHEAALKALREKAAVEKRIRERRLAAFDDRVAINKVKAEAEARDASTNGKAKPHTSGAKPIGGNYVTDDEAARSS